METTRERVLTSSFPHIASVMKMTPAMLEDYLVGATLAGPQRTPRSIWQWARKAECSPDLQSQEHARTLLHSVAGIPARYHVAAIGELLGDLEVQFLNQGQTVPEWLRQLIAALER
jgi:hypothetical protein